MPHGTAMDLLKKNDKDIVLWMNDNILSKGMFDLAHVIIQLRTSKRMCWATYLITVATIVNMVMMILNYIKK